MKAKCIVIICLLCVFLMGCSGSEYYQDTSLENFRTFTSVTGIESTSSEVEGNDTYYYYNITLDDEMFSKMEEWETYLLDYGFSYVTSKDGAALYVKDEYYLCTFINGASTESIQYVISVPK